MMVMPKMTEHDRLAELEARQRKLNDDVETARRPVRERYAAMVSEIAIERLTERAFRDVLTQIVRVGGEAALAALKGLPATS
jgi:hypothetical protein